MLHLIMVYRYFLPIYHDTSYAINIAFEEAEVLNFHNVNVWVFHESCIFISFMIFFNVTQGEIMSPMFSFKLWKFRFSF
jgi:hypothetical protein